MSDTPINLDGIFVPRGEPTAPGSSISLPKIDERPQRQGWAPGGYSCRCRACREHFMGDKRSILCADCAYALPDQPALPPAMHQLGMLPRPVAWAPIDTAPKDGQVPLYLARFVDGKLVELDWDAFWEYEEAGFEGPYPSYYCWKSHNGLEDPTHWAYQDAAPPVELPVDQQLRDENAALRLAMGEILRTEWCGHEQAAAAAGRIKQIAFAAVAGKPVPYWRGLAQELFACLKVFGTFHRHSPTWKTIGADRVMRQFEDLNNPRPHAPTTPESPRAD